MKSRTQAQPITKKDLNEFLEEDSSFAFEMKVREIFASRKFRYEHGGTYVDPHTGQPRQFDLQVDLNCRLMRVPLRLFLAVECKCLSEFAPMLVYRSPRTVYEAGHQVIATTCGDRDRIMHELANHSEISSWIERSGPFPSVCTLDFSPRQSMYPTGEPVGKSIDVVSKDGNGKFKAGDKEVFGRWTQALQSASALLGKLSGDFYGDKSFAINWFLPILVVPDERLFVVDFDDAGTQLDEPKNVSRTSFFVDYSPPNSHSEGPPFKFGHLEIVTYSALCEFVANATGEQSSFFLERQIDERACFEALSRY